ncbi:hypothetical protein CJ179_38760 [Rhodococcus sp. ACS1]|uniref:hypothetical protein n=1 Tax=Rhodococcus sp. ACS1 TaxID=2028570 RepID=UPI000BB15A8F|nr:hypothetical protein [Rhodococcus sp. ACS1]PBC38543.1 hypothetical protein CJ179_38760 [Rhodococcus sp. ACS1]
MSTPANPSNEGHPEESRVIIADFEDYKDLKFIGPDWDGDFVATRFEGGPDKTWFTRTSLKNIRETAVIPVPKAERIGDPEHERYNFTLPGGSGPYTSRHVPWGHIDAMIHEAGLAQAVRNLIIEEEKAPQPSPLELDLRKILNHAFVISDAVSAKRRLLEALDSGQLKFEEPPVSDEVPF